MYWVLWMQLDRKCIYTLSSHSPQPVVCWSCLAYTHAHLHILITQPLQFIPFVTHGWSLCSNDQRGKRQSQAREEMVSAAAGWRGRWTNWSSIWLGLVGCKLPSALPEALQRWQGGYSVRIFPAICAFVCVKSDIHVWEAYSWWHRHWQYLLGLHEWPARG